MPGRECLACLLPVEEGEPVITVPYQDDLEHMVRHATEEGCNNARDLAGKKRKSIRSAPFRRSSRHDQRR